MVVGKLPFTALTDGVTGEATEPPHLVSVITGFHRSKEGTKQQIQLSSETGRGCAGLGRKSQQLRIPPRPAPTLHPHRLTWGLSGSYSFCFPSSQNSLSSFPQKRQAGRRDEIKALEVPTSSS